MVKCNIDKIFNFLAQRAIELDNPLIKARPMTVASSISLTTAYKHDLKPAMKRPQTNLQTARRLITTHLGTKSKLSKEQNAKERNDLKIARGTKCNIFYFLIIYRNLF